MNYEVIRKEIVQGNGITSGMLEDLLAALAQVYPMMLLANLTQNTYTMIADQGFLHRKLEVSGNYDEMITRGCQDVHPSYRDAFMDAFDRQTLINRYGNGVTRVWAKLYQKDANGAYHWVTTKVIRLEDESGDVVQLCVNENVPE